MASSIGTIYNATIGSSELEPDNEHTLFTTNSSTTQIIKNIDLTLGTGLKLNGTYLEVNGHNAADLSSGSVSGELIIPPNSTVKIKDYSYPVTFYKEYEQFIDSSDYGWVNVHVRDETNGSIVHTFTQNKSATALQSTNNIVEILDGLHDHDANGTTSNERNANKYMSYIYHDNNSVQQAYNNYSYLHSFGNTPPTGNYRYVNYRPLMLDRDPRRGQQYACPLGGTCWYVNNMYDVTSNIVYAYGSLGTAQTSQTQYTRWNGQTGTTVSPATNQGSFSPSMTSSYPRGHCIGDWIFYVPSSGYSDRVYGIYLNTGQFFYFNCSGPNATIGGNYDFTVSINQATDKLVIWRSDGANSRLIRNVPEKTITELATLTPGGTQQINCDSTYITTPDNHARHTFASCQLSDQMDGGVGLIGHNTNKFHSIDFDGVEKYSHTQFSGALNTTVTYAQNRLWKRTMMPLTSAELSAAGISQPTMGIKIIGYTST